MRERRRYQKGSLKPVVMNGIRVWKAQWRDENLVKRSSILGRCAGMSEAMARAKFDEVLRPINARVLNGPNAGREARVAPITFQELVEGHYYPYARKKWKEDSTKKTTEQRINYHLVRELAAVSLNQFTRQDLQGVLDRKAAQELSFSVVDHLHRDMKGIFQFAIDEGLMLGRNPAGRLVTPREAVRPRRMFLSEDQVRKYLMVLELRERLFSLLVLFSGLRPGEAIALRLGDHHGNHIDIARRIYKGSVGSPKNDRSQRPVGLGPRTLAGLLQWKERLLDNRPEAWLFPSENPAMPLWVDNCWRRNMKPRLDTVGLGWASFQVLRRTHSTLSNKHGNDPKVTSDQMGNGIGVNLDVYTQSDLEQKIEAATRLEDEVLERTATMVENTVFEA